MVVSGYGSSWNAASRTVQYMWDDANKRWTLAACSWNYPDANFDAYGTIDGNWHQVVMPFNGAYTKMYVDGQYKMTSAVNQSGRTTTLSGTNYIGRNISSTPGYLVGLLDDMAMWNDANMTDAQIASLWNAPHVPGLGDYGAYKMDKLFQVYGETLSSWRDGAMTWEKITGLTGHAAGDVWSDGLNYYVQLDATGGGVATVPEPSTLALLGIGAFGLLGYGWRRRGSRPCVA